MVVIICYTAVDITGQEKGATASQDDFIFCTKCISFAEVQWRCDMKVQSHLSAKCVLLLIGKSVHYANPCHFKT